MANDIMSNSLTAIKAYSTMLGNTANNVANINTEAYKPVQTTMVESAGGGVTALTTRGQNADSVDLSQEAVSLITAKNSMQASMVVVKTAVEMQKNVVDMLV